MKLEKALFAPANPRILGVVRAGVATAAVMELIGSWERVLRLASPGAVRLPIVDVSASVFLAASPVVLIVWLLAGLAFAVGYRTSISGAVLALVMFGLVTADEQLYSNHSYLIALVTASLTLMNAGAAWSLDARRHGEPATAPAWTIHALRIQLTIVYLFAVAAKLNPTFLSGTVIAASLRRGGIGFPEPWIQFEVMLALSVSVVMCELFLAVALWHRRWRPAAFVIGFTLHIGIVLLMHAAWDLAVFTLTTLALYVAFVDAPRHAHAVVWDDACGFCGTWVRWFRRLDWLDTLRFVPRSRLAVSDLGVGDDEALEALHVVGPRRTSRAFAAVTDVLAVLPVGFLWSPLLRLSPVRTIGERAYRSVARRRTCPIDAPATAHDPSLDGSALA